MVFKVIQISLIFFLALQNKALVGGERDVTRKLPGPLEEGMSVKIIGSVISDGSTFQINFQTAKLWEEDVYFHMRMRYKFNGDNRIIFNTWKGEEDGGHWEEEETDYGIPSFYRDGYIALTGLDIRITAKEDHFYINMNGKEYTFKYRSPIEELKNVKLLTIEGEYEVKSITWETEIGDKNYIPYE